MKVPFLDPDIRAADVQRATASIKSGWLAAGPYTAEFEKKLARHFRAHGSVMVNSCTAALHLGVMLAGVKKGDEVITTPMSSIATSNVILYQGANVVFADVDSETGILDIKEVEKKITKKTKAIIVVHLYGQMADMKAYQRLGKKYGIHIIEDAAHAIESVRDGIRPGELGLCACLSFHAAKNLTSGQGGALIVNTEEHVRAAKLLRRFGMRNMPDGKRRMEIFGYKYDTADYQAALLIGQLDRIKENHKKRLAVLKRYREGFRRQPGIRFPKPIAGSVHANHLFVIWVDPKKRDAIRIALTKKGVENTIHFEPIHLEPFYRKAFGYREGTFPVAEHMSNATISLPTYQKLSRKQQDYVIRSVIAAVRESEHTI